MPLTFTRLSYIKLVIMTSNILYLNYLKSNPHIPHPKTNRKIPRTAILIQIYPEHLSLDKCHLIKAEHHPRYSSCLADSADETSSSISFKRPMAESNARHTARPFVRIK